MTTNQQWQPIETAPKDTLILVWAEHEAMSVAEFDTIRDYWRLSENVDWRHHILEYDPTHWMPLPEPPL